MSELKEINDTLKKIESKIEDKSPKDTYHWTNFFDYEKRQEESRKKREEERNEEILELQRAQTKSIKIQENFNRIIAFTGAIIALTTIYAFLIQSINLKYYSQTYGSITLIFLALVIICLIPLIGFIINFWKKEVFGR